MSKKQEEEIDSLVNALIDVKEENEQLKKVNVELTECLRRCHFIMGYTGPAFLDKVEKKSHI